MLRTTACTWGMAGMRNRPLRDKVERCDGLMVLRGDREVRWKCDCHVLCVLTHRYIEIG